MPPVVADNGRFLLPIPTTTGWEHPKNSCVCWDPVVSLAVVVVVVVDVVVVERWIHVPRLFSFLLRLVPVCGGVAVRFVRVPILVLLAPIHRVFRFPTIRNSSLLNHARPLRMVAGCLVVLCTPTTMDEREGEREIEREKREKRERKEREKREIEKRSGL